MAKEKGYKPFIVKPTLTRTCERCGKHFTVGHPKDPETLCEECRKARQNGQDV